MAVLPLLSTKTRLRPGHPKFEEVYLIPDETQYPDVWESAYAQLFSLQSSSPIQKDFIHTLDSHFGFFGYRVHPVTRELRYFHSGIFLKLPGKQSIHPILPGILEYSGYGAVNGYYILISHPDIQTEDGYILHSMYCHLKKPLVKFNSYQKMLREISLGSYPEIPVSLPTVLGKPGTSGLSVPHTGVFLQISLRKFGETPIVLDPLRLYQTTTVGNTTADITDAQDAQSLFA